MNSFREGARRSLPGNPFPRSGPPEGARGRKQGEAYWKEGQFPSNPFPRSVHLMGPGVGSRRKLIEKRDSFLVTPFPDQDPYGARGRRQEENFWKKGQFPSYPFSRSGPQMGTGVGGRRKIFEKRENLLVTNFADGAPRMTGLLLATVENVLVCLLPRDGGQVRG